MNAKMLQYGVQVIDSGSCEAQVASHATDRQTEERLMTRDEARAMLAGRWGVGETLTPDDVRAIEACAEPHETALDTVARVAQVDVSGIRAFDHAGIRHRLAVAQARDGGRTS
jgi:hypothetical protein